MVSKRKERKKEGGGGAECTVGRVDYQHYQKNINGLRCESLYQRKKKKLGKKQKKRKKKRQ
jgi:hypothetical protein